MGGLILLGMDEDEQARATGPSGISVDDGEISRIRGVIAARVHPLPPAVEVQVVENPDTPGTGFILFAVPRSPMAPHAVVTDQAMRFPRPNIAYHYL